MNQTSEAIWAEARVALGQGNLLHAQALFERLLEQAHQQRDTFLERMVLHELGKVARYIGNYRQARLRLAQEMAILQEGTLQRKTIGWVSANIYEQGIICLLEEDLDGAESLFKHALFYANQGDHALSRAFALSGIGEVALRRKDFTRAQINLKESAKQFELAEDLLNANAVRERLARIATA
ncbi:MAG: hypothetical protein OHK0023_14620 [Anaerolineae bacterium]